MHLSSESKKEALLIPFHTFRYLFQSNINHLAFQIGFNTIFFVYFQPGDHIEKLNNVNVVGKRHYEVARLLKDIPTNSTFTLRLIEPMKSGFQGIGPRNASRGGNKKGYGTGKETLRFKANGNAAVEEQVRGSTFKYQIRISSALQTFALFFSFHSHSEARWNDTNGHWQHKCTSRQFYGYQWFRTGRTGTPKLYK